MTLQSTFAFALVLVAAGNVALVWIIYERLTRELVLSRFTSENAFKSCTRRLDASEKVISELKREAPADLADRVDALAADLEHFRTIHKRFAGRFDQFVGQQTALKHSSETPEETRARLRTEHSLPKIGKPL